jgi:nicotinamide riboside transporter PnuC
MIIIITTVKTHHYTTCDCLFPQLNSPPGQIAQVYRQVEGWYWYIVANAIFMVILFMQGIYMWSAATVLYLLSAIYGWYEFEMEYRKQEREKNGFMGDYLESGGERG